MTHTFLSILDEVSRSSMCNFYDIPRKRYSLRQWEQKSFPAGAL